MALNAGVLVIGDFVFGGIVGHVYRFKLNNGQWLWVPEQDLLATGPTDSGDAVAIFGDNIAVGSPNQIINSAQTGTAYWFVRKAGSWSLQDSVTAGGLVSMDKFGAAVAINADWGVVGKPGGTRGAAYTFPAPLGTRRYLG